MCIKVELKDYLKTMYSIKNIYEHILVDEISSFAMIFWMHVLYFQLNQLLGQVYSVVQKLKIILKKNHDIRLSNKHKYFGHWTKSNKGIKCWENNIWFYLQ